MFKENKILSLTLIIFLVSVPGKYLRLTDAEPCLVYRMDGQEQ